MKINVLFIIFLFHNPNDKLSFNSWKVLLDKKIIIEPKIDT